MLPGTRSLRKDFFFVPLLITLSLNSQKRLEPFSLFILFLLFLSSFSPLSVEAQQCTLPSRIFLPIADTAKYQQLGMAVAIDGEYMVAGMEDNCAAQVYAGVALLYKLDAQNNWVQIAELMPSDPGKYGKFGTAVDISGNTIVIRGQEYNDPGFRREKLYVFEKPASGEWISTTENYVITKDFGEGISYSGYSTFKLNGDELVTFAAELNDWKIEVHRKSAGVFSLSQSLELPPSPWGGDYAWTLAVTDGLIAIGSEQFEHPDRSNGAAFIFEKINGAYNPAPVQLRASEQSASDWRGFGINIAAHGNTVVVLGLRYREPDYVQTFYVFERPMQGWQDEARSQLLEHSGYVWYNSKVIANDNYILSTGGNYEGVVGFRKSGSAWTSDATLFEIAAPQPEETLFGWQIAMNAQHLVIGCPGRFRHYGDSDEYLSAYHSATGAWDAPGLEYRQRLGYASINATDDFFGESFSVYNNRIAITARGDDKKGADSGVVYVFDTEKTSTLPEQLIYNPEDENFSGFGRKIAMGDSIMFISAPFKDSVGVDGKAIFYSIGKVYVYRLRADGWTYSSQIIAPDIHSEVTFGQNVVWSPGYCAVTEFYGGSSESIGRVHIYKENKSNGKFEYLATLDPQVHLRSDFFGKSMVMTDSMMVIGTGGGAPNSSYRQSAYVFMKKGEWTSTTEDAQLMCSDTGWIDRFGASVSMYGEYIVVGAPNWPGFDPRPIPRAYIIPGAVYIYKRPSGGWKGLLTETAKLSPSDPTDFGNFGASVVIDHNDIFVGSPNVSAQYNYSNNLTNHDNRLIPGKVYHYTMPPGGWKSTNQEKRQLHSFEPEIVDGYGASMYVSNRYLYVGVMLDDTEKGFRTGSVQTMMQLPAIDAPPVLCVDQAPVQLSGFPKGGQWSGPGVNSSGMFSPTVAGGGMHHITYSFAGCEGTFVIEVLPLQMFVHEQSPAIQTKCIGQSISVAFRSGEDPETYMWYYRETLNHPQVKFDSMKQVISVSEAGYYEVVVSRGACPARREEFRVMDEAQVFVEVAPVPLICSIKEVQLSATPATGTWTGNGVSGDGIFDPASVPEGSYELHYTVVTSAGCQWEESVTVYVDILKQPELLYDGKPICGYNPVELEVGNIDYAAFVAWSRDGTPVNGEGGMSIRITTPGNYSAVVIKGDCRLETEIRNVPGETVVIAFQSSTICSEAPVSLKATPAGGTWSGIAVTPHGEFNPSGLSNGTYPQVYTLVTPIGCTWRQTLDLVVDVLEPPSLRTDITEICINRPATLMLENVDFRSSIQWFYQDEELLSGENDRTISTNRPGRYFADVSKISCTLRTPVIELVPEPDSVFVPNVFTVNGDAINDHFEIHSEGIEEIRLSVFNRYGRIVFETGDVAFRWPALDVSSGVYFWRLNYRTCADTMKELRGWVNVISANVK